MSEAEQEPKTTPPVLAWKTFDNSLRSLTPIIPGRIDRGVFRSQSGAGQTQILHAYRYFNMVDAKGVPQDRLVQLVKSEGAERQRVLREMLTASYPFLRDKTVDLASATHDMLSEQFKKLASGDTVRKCMTFFIPAAKAAGFELSPFIRELGKRSPTNGKPRKARTTRTNATPSQEQQQQPNTPEQQAAPLSWHEMLLSKFPAFDPAWPDEVKAKWFESFSDLMSRGGPK